MPIVDSSSYVKYFAKEPGWDKAAEHLLQPTSIGLALTEVANALAKKVSIDEISKDDAALLLRGMIEITRLVGQNDSVIHALKISIDKRVTVYDALFIVAALEQGLGLTTSDAKQARVAEELGVSVSLI